MQKERGDFRVRRADTSSASSISSLLGDQAAFGRTQNQTEKPDAADAMQLTSAQNPCMTPHGPVQVLDSSYLMSFQGEVLRASRTFPSPVVNPCYLLPFEGELTQDKTSPSLSEEMAPCDPLFPDVNWSHDVPMQEHRRKQEILYEAHILADHIEDQAALDGDLVEESDESEDEDDIDGDDGKFTGEQCTPCFVQSELIGTSTGGTIRSTRAKKVSEEARAVAHGLAVESSFKDFKCKCALAKANHSDSCISTRICRGRSIACSKRRAA